jgi:hypothetical protein
MSASNPSVSDPSTSDRLALVSSLYGPGATACWYLTCFSCLASCTVHPKKRKSDSIESDFIASLIFPTVAGAHLISQVQSYPSQAFGMPLPGDGALVQRIASMSASLTITETYLALCVILLLPALLFRSVERGALLALTGLFCVASDVYVFFFIPSIRSHPDIFDRSFIFNFFPVLITILVVVSALLGLMLSFIFLFLRRCRPEPLAQLPSHADPDVVERYRLANTVFLESREVSRLTFLAMPFGLVSLFATLFPISKDIALFAMHGIRGLPSTGRRLLDEFLDEFFPKTDTGIMELDQAVALLAGMTVLGFSVYGAADEQYRRWWETERARREEDARQIDRAMREDVARRTSRLAGRVRQGREQEDFELYDMGREELEVEAGGELHEGRG